MKNILVTLEIEKEAQILVNQAKDLAKKFDAKIWLLHVAAPNPDFVGYEVGPQYVRDNRAETLKGEHHYLRNLAQELEKEGINSQSVLLQGATIDTIISESEKLKVDLIVIGHHHHGLLHKIFVGSTASEVINKSTIPILIVPIN